MFHPLEDYLDIVGERVIADLYKTARGLSEKHIVEINSTSQGGGVAEMLYSLIPFMNYVGVETGWRILHGNPEFFQTTKKIHNALQGERITIPPLEWERYVGTNRQFSQYTHISQHDCILVHDAQPLPLITNYHKIQPWIWRCHVDLSNPDPGIWKNLKKFLLRFDLVMVSNKAYLHKDLPVEQVVIPPAIDPLSTKNEELSDNFISQYLERCHIPIDKPLITQISRFDKWKNPTHAIDIFRRVKREVDCRLVLCGSMAADDPEGVDMIKQVQDCVRKITPAGDIFVITRNSNILVNALQRTSAVVFQCSSREGFGLTVTEALWKGKPVVASNVGGIPLQITDGESGYLVDPGDLDGFADRIVGILKDPDNGSKMGENGKKHVLKHFLITRLIQDHLSVAQDAIEKF